jgi:hypothetical protein
MLIRESGLRSSWLRWFSWQKKRSLVERVMIDIFFKELTVGTVVIFLTQLEVRFFQVVIKCITHTYVVNVRLVSGVSKILLT